MGRTSPEIKIREAAEYALSHQIPPEALEAYRAHFNNALRRGIGFELSFADWWTWWKTDDRWSMRGVGQGRFVMARRGDVGPYALDNIYCTTQQQHIRDIDPARLSASQRAVWEAKTPEERADWHLAVRGDGHPKSKSVLTPLGRFGSAALAAEAHGFTRQHAARLAKTNAAGWSYEASESG